MLKLCAVLALAGSAGSANAFPPIMSMDIDRRSIVKTCIAAVAAAPLLRPQTADAYSTSAADLGLKYKPRSPGALSGNAPIITIMDHRGCTRQANKEYRGPKSNDQNDEMLVKVQSQRIPISYSRATSQLQESISYKAKGIDGAYTGKKDLGGNSIPASFVKVKNNLESTLMNAKWGVTRVVCIIINPPHQRVLSFLCPSRLRPPNRPESPVV